MSRPIPWAETVMREYDCQDCGSGLGARCRTRSGRFTSTSHASRWEQAVADGRLGRSS